MRNFLLVLFGALLIFPSAVFAAPEVCAPCDGVEGTQGTCGAGLKCVGDKNAPGVEADGKAEGYCQYNAANKVALCNPLKSSTIGDLIERLADFIFNVALVLTPVLVLYAGFLFLTSAGDPKKIATAKNILLWTVIGLGIILLSKGIVAIMKGLLGI